MKVLVLGVSGMLGNAMLRTLAMDARFQVFGSARSAEVLKYFAAGMAEKIITGFDVENSDALAHLFARVRPQLVINCIGLVKQLASAEDPLLALPINAVLPHRLARLCELTGARLVHISTDCVFTGRKGGYFETDETDAQDLYGLSKLLGEVDYPHAVTLRTSLIGHELSNAHGLIGWFLGQTGVVKGFTQAIFSGMPTCELARVICDRVVPHPELYGVYNVAAAPISKYDLLQLVNKEYDKDIHIEPDNQLKIDRSLNPTRFNAATGYVAPTWPELIAQMRAFS